MIEELHFHHQLKTVYLPSNRDFFQTLAERLAVLFNSFSKTATLKVLPKYRSYMMTPEALTNIHFLLMCVIKSKIPGEIIEIGCYEGLTAVFLQKSMNFFQSQKNLTLFDSFEGLQDFTEKDEGTNLTKGLCMSQEDTVISNFKKEKLRVPKIITGNVYDTLPSKLPSKIAFAHIDLDLYGPTLFALKSIRSRLTEGSIVVFDDYGNPSIPGVKAAVKDALRGEKQRINLTEAGEYSILPKIWPQNKNGFINKKYQAYWTVTK